MIFHSVEMENGPAFLMGIYHISFCVCVCAVITLEPKEYNQMPKWKESNNTSLCMPGCISKVLWNIALTPKRTHFSIISWVEQNKWSTEVSFKLLHNGDDSDEEVLVSSGINIKEWRNIEQSMAINFRIVERITFISIRANNNIGEFVAYAFAMWCELIAFTRGNFVIYIKSIYVAWNASKS